MIEEHANYIDGQWRPAFAEHVFEVSAAGDRNRPMARFPRSSARDIRDAVGACDAAEPAWQAMAFDERRTIAARALARLSADPDPGERVAASLGLESEEIARHGSLFAHALERDLSRARHVAPFAASGILALQPHWSELWIGPVREVLSALLAGRAVVLLSDPNVPFIAEGIARALDASALPRGVLALVHDDGDACLDGVLGDVRIDTLRASGPRARVRRIERQAHRRPARETPEHTGAGTAHEGRDRGADRAHSVTTSGSSLRRRVRFGAGLDDRRGPELDLSLVRNRSYVVTRAADPAIAAAEIIDGAFGRVQALSGQGPGSIGRVLCHARQFSRFSAELLTQLDRRADVARPLAAREAATTDHLRRACELGLDEGATLVFSRREGARRPVDPPAEPRARPLTEREDRASRTAAAAPSRDRRAEAILWPAVFTNVEEHMRLAWLGRPAPVLCLIRVASDERGAALAQEIDRDPLAEDLSAAEEAGAEPA